MDGIHDMGGMHGFGAVPYERGDDPWHDDWEPRAMVVALLASRATGDNLDRFRHAIERLPPPTYLTVGYFGRWIRAAETLWSELGPAPATGTGQPRTSVRPGGQPGRFGVGDRVRTTRASPPGHTRLPRYCRGMVGEVSMVHGTYVFPDTNAHDLGERPQTVYAVRFAATDLWGDGAEPSTYVHVDLYEDYLEPAEEP